MRPLACLATLSALAIAPGLAAESLIEPNERIAVIDSEHLRAFVPASEAERLRPLVARADAIYVQLAHDAGYAIRRRLYLYFADHVDDHNGFSTVVPFPIVEVDLAPAPPESSIFDGSDHLERTLTHELAHHISNDRNQGFRRALELVFGRILPFDYLSLLVAYLSTPAHQTMPPFWHEGLAQWSETTYADPASPWSGRGRDSLTHMVWRLDVAAEALPQVRDWRVTYPHWPFGARIYVYGLAYLRWLQAAHGQIGVWRMIDAQARQWPFRWDEGVTELLGADHWTLEQQARAALIAEERANLATLRAQPVTAPKRLTEPDTEWGAPAWLPDGSLIAAMRPTLARPAFAKVARDGTVHRTGLHAWALGNARSLPDGAVVYQETPGEWYPWARSRAYLLTPDGEKVEIPGKRLIEPDAAALNAHGRDQEWQVAAVHLLPAGAQELVVIDGRLEHGLLGSGWSGIRRTIVPTQGRAWSPAFRPVAGWRNAKDGELCWVETDAHGSRLVLAPLADPAKRTVLADLRGRILHPVWDRAGAAVYFCSDASGVSNAYLVAVDQPGKPVPLTNTIGGITACVPSPDGKELAVIDHDSHGPFLARIANDPAKRPAQLPAIALAWPAPIAGAPAAAAPVAGAPAAQRDALPPAPTQPPRPYHGLGEIRPWFWTPTLLPVPEGGIGALGVATDPLFTHEAIASAGVSPDGLEPVGMAEYAYSGWIVDFALIGWRSERRYTDQVVAATGQEFDYVDTLSAGEARVGTGLAGFERRFQAFVAGGVADYRVVSRAARDYAGLPLVSVPAFTGLEQYAEATVAYDDSTFFPTSYAPEDGAVGAITVRHSDFGGALDRDRALARGTLSIPVWPEMGQQLSIAGAIGWSRGDRTLQGSFSIGGALAQDIPRGYYDTEAIGDHLFAGSIAYRVPLWRPFRGFGSSYLAHRQLVLELFYDAGKVSDGVPFGHGGWFRSVGAELHDCWEFWSLIIQPGVGVAKQIDGGEHWVPVFALDFRL